MKPDAVPFVPVPTGVDEESQQETAGRDSEPPHTASAGDPADPEIQSTPQPGSPHTAAEDTTPSTANPADHEDSTDPEAQGRPTRARNPPRVFAYDQLGTPATHSMNMSVNAVPTLQPPPLYPTQHPNPVMPMWVNPYSPQAISMMPTPWMGNYPYVPPWTIPGAR